MRSVYGIARSIRSAASPENRNGLPPRSWSEVIVGQTYFSMCSTINSVPSEMADVGPGPGIVHRVGQVADQDHVLAEACHVSQTERPAQHAHVRVDARGASRW